MYLDHPRAFGGLHHCAEFGWNQCGSFDNMQVLIFCKKNAFSYPQNCVFGGFDPINGDQCHWDLKKALPCAETRHMTYQSSKSATGAGCAKPKHVTSHVFAETTDVSQRHTDLHVLSYPRRTYIF